VGNVNQEKNALPAAVEAEMLDASARMVVAELLEGENEDYARGFQEGYTLCLELTGRLDSVLSREA
jgi:hypothetical protein